MGAVRIIVLVVAAVAALGLALVVRNMATGSKSQAVAVAAPAPQKPMVQVLVAKRDLPVGTRLTPADMNWQAWPADATNPSFITDGARPAAVPVDAAGKVGAKASAAAKAAETALTGGGAAMQGLTGAIVREPILANEPMVERKIVRGGQGGFMSVVLTPGMRAVALPVNVESGAGGFILPGDRVDVMLSHKSDQANGSGGSVQVGVATMVMRNLRVLAVDQQVKPAKDAQSIVGATVTLEVPATDVELLLRSKAQGELALALRSYADLGGPSGRAEEDEVKSTNVRVIRSGRVSEMATR